MGYWFQASAAPNQAADEAVNRVVTERGPHHKVWKQVIRTTNELGQVTLHTNSFTEMATGMHQWRNGKWVDADDSIQLTADGSAAFATNSQHQVGFGANIHVAGAIDLLTPHGQHLRSTVLGLSFDDPSTGKNVIIAQTQDSIGQLLPNAKQIIYTNALIDSASSFFADVLYTHKRNSFEQDIILREQPPSPAQFGLNPATTRLQVWTEFFNPPEPTVTTNSRSVQMDDGGEQRLGDEKLAFLSMEMGHGHAFVGGGATNAAEMTANGMLLVPVVKHWVHDQGRIFLVEEVPLQAIASKLSVLPPSIVSSTNAPTNSVSPPQSFFRSMPAEGQQARMNHAPMRLAQTDVNSHPGFTVDYNMVNSTMTNFTFQSDTTYYLSGECDLYLTTTLEGGTVIKCQTSGEVAMVMNGNINCLTAPYRPAVFTCTNDNTVGVALSPSNSPLLSISTFLDCPQGGNISNVRFSYAFNALSAWGADVEISDCQFVNCSHPITVNSGTTNLGLHNVLISMNDSINNSSGFCGCPPGALTIYSQAIHCYAEHLTADLGSQNFITYFTTLGNPANTSVVLTNCIMLTPHLNPLYTWGSAVGYTVGTNFTYWASSNPGNLFQTVGAGSHYLTTNSSCHAAGTLNINPATLTDIRRKTTYPPVDLYTNYFHANTNLSPTAARDTGTPDLGYHYDPLDYTLQSAVVSNINVSLLGGAAIGFYDTTLGYNSDSSFHGISVEDGGSFTSQGSPTNFNQMVWYNVVQEQANTNWISPASAYQDMIVCNDSLGTPIQIQCQFTHFGILANSTWDSFFFQNDASYDGVSGTVNVQECEFGPALVLFLPPSKPRYPLTISITNCLFERSYEYFQDNVTNIFTLSLQNNLQYGGELDIYADSGPTNIISLKDNFFCKCILGIWSDDGRTLTNYIATANNAYTTNLIPLTGKLYQTNNSDVILTNFTFQTGAFGYYYQPSGNPLFGAGDTNANVVGLYDYTVLTNGLPETTGKVSIGYHYPAAPVILTQPISQSACAGSSAAFSVVVTNIIPVTYQWYKAGSSISGATGSSYTRASLTVADSTNYNVIVTDAAGSVTSSNAILTVTPQSQPVVSVDPGADGTNAIIGLNSSEASVFISALTSTVHTNFHPAIYTNGTPYADSVFARVSTCSDSVAVGINITRLPVVTLSPNGSYFNYPSNLVLTLGSEDLSNMVYGLYCTELARVPLTSELTNKIATALSLRSSGYSDEDIRTNLINNTLRNSSEYISKFGATGPLYIANTNYTIEYSLDGGNNWSAYVGPIPISTSVGVQARVVKATHTDNRTLYAYLTSPASSNAFTYIPAAWLTTYFGTNYQTNTNALPNAIQENGLTTLQDYQQGINPLTGASFNPTNLYYQASSPQDIINVEFTANSTADAVGPAAAGYSTNDYWNCWSSSADSCVLFGNGISLRDVAGNTLTNAKLYALSGPLINTRQFFIQCSGFTFESDLGAFWTDYWNCARVSYKWASNACYAPYIVAWSGEAFHYDLDCLFGELPVPDWLNYRNENVLLQNLSSIPLWLPAYDMADPLVFWDPDVFTFSDNGNIDAYGLTTHAWAVRESFEWEVSAGYDYGITNDQQGGGTVTNFLQPGNDNVYITGLPEGQYQVYLYHGSDGASVNGQPGTMLTRTLHVSAWGVDWPITAGYKRFTTNPQMPPPIDIEQLIAQQGGEINSPDISVFSDPLWVPRLTPWIHLTGLNALGGIQIVRVEPLQAPAPNALAGKRSVYLSWPGIPAASGYQIYRAQGGSTNFTYVDSSGANYYADAGLTAGVIYSYYIVATNDAGSGPISQPPVTAMPFDGLGTAPPTLNWVKPVQLAAQSDGTFLVPFMKVLAASDAQDADDHAVWFKVNKVFNGTMSINGNNFDPATNCTFNAGTTMIWQPLTNVPNLGLEAFTVSARNTNQVSVSSVPVTIVPVPATYLVGWGSGLDGGLGNPNSIPPDVREGYAYHAFDSLSPVKVANLQNIVNMSHDEALVASVVTADGSLWMWGWDRGSGEFGEGQPNEFDPGVGHAIILPVPFKVQMRQTNGSLENFTNVVQISTGAWGNAAAIRSDGTLWTWGMNDSSDLGYTPDPTNVLTTPMGAALQVTKKACQVKGMTNGFGEDLPVLQALISNGALALCADHSVWWWGTLEMSDVQQTMEISGPEEGTMNEYLNPGGVNNNANAVPSRLTVFDTGPKVIQIANNYGHCMALRQDGTVWEFGYVPRLMFDMPATGPDGGGCAVWLSYCCFSATPLQVTNLPTDVQSVACDDQYSLALMKDGTVYAWGLSSFYCPGSGWGSPTPVQVSGLTNIVKIDVKAGLALALDKSGRVWAWGRNDLGQMGRARDPEKESPFHTEPVEIFGIGNATDIMSSGQTAYAVASLGEGRPVGLIGTPLDQAAALTWQPYTGTSYYKVYRAEETGGAGVVVGTPSANNFTDTGLSNATPYFYTVTAIVNGVETPPSDEIAVVPMPPPSWPTFPHNLNLAPIVSASCREVHVQWTNAVAALSYKVLRSTSTNGTFSQVGTTDGFSYTDQSVGPGTNYYYCIVADNTAGNSARTPFSMPIQLDTNSCMPAPVVTGLSVPNGVDGQVILSWNEVAVTNGGTTNYPDAYRVQWFYYSADPTIQFRHGKPTPTEGTDFIFRDVALNPATDGNLIVGWDSSAGLTNYSYTIGNASELQKDFEVWCKVSAVFNGEPGNDSVIVGPVLACSTCPRPDAPTGIVAVGGCEQVYLQWTDELTASFYQLRYRIQGTTNWTYLTNHITDNQFWHTGLTTNTTYEYELNAVAYLYDSTNHSVLTNGSDFSSPPVAATANCPPGYSSVTFTALADAYDSMIYVHWESLGNPPTLQSFVERKLASDPDDNYVQISTTDFGLAYLDKDVVNGTTYKYRVTAIDEAFDRFTATTTNVTPIATGFLTLLATNGNGYVGLSWNPLNFAGGYQIGRSLKSGGPYQIVTEVTDTSFLDQGVANGINQYYVVTALLAYNQTVTSQEVKAMPLGTLAPLPPANLVINQTLGTNGQGELLFSWTPSAGAVSNELDWVSTSTTKIYSGAGTAFAWSVPSGVTSGQTLNFKVQAFSSTGQPSLPTTASIIYEGETNGATNLVMLSIGNHDVTGTENLKITGPTNLVLRASVKASDAGDTTVAFFDLIDGVTTQIGSAPGPQAQITWFQVPQGQHQIWAEAATSSSVATFLGGIGGTPSGTTYQSLICSMTLQLVPTLGTYQASATDLQLPAPGLPISLSRSYDSRSTNAFGCLGKGWSASWDDGASLQIASGLSNGWVAAGIGGLGRNMYFIAESNSHLATITLPGGSTVYFTAQLNAQDGFDPRFTEQSVSLGFNAFSVNQGSLACSGNDNPGALEVSGGIEGSDWDAQPLALNTGDNTTPFSPTSFSYVTPAGAQYIFGLSLGSNVWKLTQIIDQNGNSLSYKYNSTNQLTNVVHSNGRQIQLAYASGTATNVSGSSVNGNWIKVYDTGGLLSVSSTNCPVVKYFLDTNGAAPALEEFDKLTGRNGVYESTRYVYGTSTNVDDCDRLQEVYDGRGVRVLHNEYGDPGGTPKAPDGRMISQTDAQGHSTTWSIDTNNTLVVTTTVNGTNQSVTVNHDASGAVSGVQGATSTTYAYDANGNVISQTDASGNAKTTGYNDLNQPVNQTDEEGNTTSTQLDQAGRPTMTVDANGNTNTFQYDANGNQTLVIDPLGAATYTGYAAPITNSDGSVIAGLVSTTTNVAPGVPYSVVTSYTYYTTGGSGGSPGELQSMTMKGVDNNGNPVGAVESSSYQYDSNGNRTQETKIATVNGVSGTAVTTQYFYDAQNRMVQTVDALNHTNSVTYNALGKQATTTDALGRVTTYTYDAKGNLIETLYPDLTVTRTVYDEQNRAIISQDRALPDTNSLSVAPATKTIYNTNGQVITVERVAFEVLFKQTASGVVEMSGGQTQYQIVESTPGTFMSCTRTVYDANGRVQYAMDARGTVTEYDYDKAGRRTNTQVYIAYTVSSPILTNSISPSGATMQTMSVYDPNGNQVSVIDPLSHETDYTYDANNRLTVTQLPFLAGQGGRNQRTTVYDGLGRRIREIDEAGVNTAFTYDYRGLLMSVTLDAGGQNPLTTSYAYDEAGNQIGQTDANGNTTSFQYDALGRRSKRVLPGTQTETFGYDALGNLLYYTNFNGVVITNQYDVMNRLTNRASTGGRLASFTYTTAGQRATMNDRSGLSTYVYDSLNRVATNTTPEGSLYYLYDATGNVTNISSSTSGGTLVSYQYDQLNRLTNVIDGRLSGTNNTAYGFDLIGNLQRIQQPNGVTNFYQYDEQNRLTQLTWNSGATTLASFAYQVGPTGIRTNSTETVNGTSRTNQWSYDRFYRMTNENIIAPSGGRGGNLGYSFDSVGNRLTRSSSITDCPDQTFSFDANDRLSSDGYDANGNTTNSASVTYKYDEENRLTNTSSGITIIYNGDGQRVSKTLSGVTTLYLVDSHNLTGYPQVLEEIVASGGTTNLNRAYTYGLSLISQRVIGGTTNFFGLDGHGTVRFLTSLSGTVTGTYAYDAYGAVLVATGATPTRLYAGEEFDTDLGLYYLRARYYQCLTGRFWTMDSYEGNNEDPLSLHKYLYCAGNPVNGIDPNGHDLTSTITSIGILAGIGAITGVAINGVHNMAVGNQFFQGAGGAALFGAAGLPLSVAFPFVGIGLATVGIYSSGVTAYTVFTSPDSTTGQKGAAVFLVGLSLFGGYAAAESASGSSFWVNAEFFKTGGLGNASMNSFQRGSADIKSYISALNGALKGTPQAGRITLAVGVAQDSSGNLVTLIATSENNGYMRPSVRPIIQKMGGIVVEGTGHAEADIVAHAKAQGWTLIGVGATRPICNSCAAEIAGAGATAATPYKNQ